MRNIIHIDGHYKIELTGKGKFLVRNGADNELGQFETNDAALYCLANDRQRCQNAVAAGNAHYAKRDEFFSAHPELETKQLEWQEWRSDMFSKISRLSRYLTAHEQNMARKDAAPHHWERLATDKAQLKAAGAAYDEAVSIDTALKAAGFAADEQGFNENWRKADRLMTTAPML